MSEKLAEGSEEIVEYRGRTITLWRTFTFEHTGRRGRPLRRWYYRIDQHGPFEAFKTPEEALWDAKVRISGKMWLLGLRDMFGSDVDLDYLDNLDLDDDEPDLADTSTSEPQLDDRRDRIRKKLEMMTVARGCTPEEEAAAKAILASM
jgi:hypothetical protein